MLESNYPSNGAVQLTQSTALPHRPKVKEIFDLLRSEHNVPDELLIQLGESFSRAAIQAVDDVVAGRQEPAKAAYFIARRLDGDAWWKR
jgi:hypothetical protein